MTNNDELERQKFGAWFKVEWEQHYEHNQYTTAAKIMLKEMAWSGWQAAIASKQEQSDGETDLSHQR